jgi:hypothetical protein
MAMVQNGMPMRSRYGLDQPVDEQQSDDLPDAAAVIAAARAWIDEGMPE